MDISLFREDEGKVFPDSLYPIILNILENSNRIIDIELDLWA